MFSFLECLCQHIKNSHCGQQVSGRGPLCRGSCSVSLLKFLEKYFHNPYLMSLRAVAARLDNTWKNFAAGLDERTTVMALSSLFHQKAENVSLLIN